jgi:EAL domain-containing protein (putative c-di-GMP-specific phosphodiesterase class I)
MGLLLVDDFVTAAIESEMLAPLGAWLFGQIAADLQLWRSQGRICPPISVSCDSRLLMDEQFVPMIQTISDRHDLQPGLLVVELREQTVIEATGQLLACLQQVALRGLGVGINDFGADRTIPISLQQLPVQTVVLNRQICRGLGHHSTVLRLVKGLIAFCHALGQKVVAEGIDHQEQRRLLVQSRCDQAQGPLLSTSATGAEVADLLELASKKGS